MSGTHDLHSRSEPSSSPRETYAAPAELRRERVKVAACYTFVLLLLYAATGLTPEFDGRGYDGRFYAAMSADETRSEPFIPVGPYCYRVLTPILLSYLPGPVVLRFRVFNLVIWFAVLISWHLLARRTGLSRNQSLLGGLILATSAWGPMFSFYTPCYIDPLMYLFIILGLNLMLAGRLDWLAVLIPIAMLQREQCALLWICALAFEVRRRGWSRKLALQFGLMLIPCVAVYLGIRAVVMPILNTTDAPPLVAIAVVRWLIREPRYLLISILGVVYALSVPLVGCLLLPAARKYVSQNPWTRYFLLFVGLSLLGGSDKARLAFLALPVLLLAFLHGAGRLCESRHLRACVWTLFLLHLFVQFPPSMMVVNGAIQAPLVDAVERGSHGANLYYASTYPLDLARITVHLTFSLGMAAVMFLALRLEGALPSRAAPNTKRGAVART